MFKRQRQQQQEKFTLVEVLVAILRVTFLIRVTMQSLVLAALFKSRAQQSSQATAWIEEAVESVMITRGNF